MRILIDTTFARIRGRSGTRVYLDELVRELRARGDVEVVETRQPNRLRPGREGRRRNPVRSAVNALRDVVWLHSGLPREARQVRADVLHHPLPAHSRWTSCPQVVTVHDVAFERMPEKFDPLWLIVARRRHRAAARRSDAVICVSEAAAAEAVSLLGADPGRVVVAPHGPGQAASFALRPSRGEPRPYFLYVGDDEPRKNLPGLFEAYARYRERVDDPFDLVLAGLAARRAGAPGVKGEGEVGAVRLAELLAGARALVHPSFHEGFGLTLAEAMALGTPVIAVRTPAIEELVGEAGLLVETAGLADALGRLHRDPELTERLGVSGRERTKALSWANCAERHVSAYTLAMDG